MSRLFDDRHFSKENIQVAQVYEKVVNITNYQGNTKQNYCIVRMAMTEITSVGDVEKREPCGVLVGI